VEPPITGVEREALLRSQIRKQMPQHDATGILLLLWVARLSRLMGLFHLHTDGLTPSIDPTGQTALTMLFLAEPVPLSPTELSRALMQTSGGMTKTLARLESEALIARVPNEQDARSVLISLTTTGQEWIRRHLDEVASHWQSNLDQSPEIDRLDAVRTMASLIAMLERANSVQP
jgi:DNA-binding MarR family transcriptional regulator